MRYVDLVIPEYSWDQKVDDIKRYHVDIVTMGDDWEGSDKFDPLQEHCEVIYLPRTDGISTSKIKKDLGLNNPISGKNQVVESKKQKPEIIEILVLLAIN
jgi:glycerol-3-phosphate cytidylyltransferase